MEKVTFVFKIDIPENVISYFNSKPDSEHVAFDEALGCILYELLHQKYNDPNIEVELIK